MLLRLDCAGQPYVRLIGKIQYRESWMHFERTIDEFILYIVADGLLCMEEAGKRYALRRGDYLFLEPDTPHRGWDAAPCEYYYVHFRHTGLSRAAEDPTALAAEMREKRRQSLFSYAIAEALPTDTLVYLPKTGRLTAGSACIQLIETACAEYEQRLEQYKPALRLYFGLLLLTLSREAVTAQLAADGDRRYARSVNKALDIVHFLNDRYSEKLTGAQIEQEFEMGFDHLNRVFKKMTGHTIFDYLYQVRIGHAKELICNTSLSFSEIAYLVGIEEGSYFTKFFRKHTGVSPTQYWKLAHDVMASEAK